MGDGRAEPWLMLAGSDGIWGVCYGVLAFPCALATVGGGGGDVDVNALYIF